MAQISNANLQSVLDKMARWAAETNGDPLASNLSVYALTSPNAGFAVANTDVLAALQTLITGLTDPYQKADLLPPVVALNSGPPALGSLGHAFWAAVRAALDVHALRYNNLAAADRSGLDALLRVLNASAPTLRAHGKFAQYFGNLSPGNVFTPLCFTLATVTVTGATSANFVHVTALDTELYAAGQIKVLNTKTEGLTSTVLTFPNAVKSGAAHSITATITTTTNQYLTAFDDVELLFTDCPVTGATITGGVSGDTFSIVIVPDRTVNGA